MEDAPNISSKGKLLDEWKTRIKQGVRYRTLYGRSRDWQKYKTMGRGFWPKGIVPVNIMYALGRALIPQVYFRNPKVSVIPGKPGYTMHARVVERIDNYLIRELGLKDELKSMILDCFYCGRGPGILGYDTEFGFNPAFMSDEYEDSSLTTFNKKGERIEYNIGVKPGMPWFLRCNPLDFIAPWGTHKWGENQWYAFRKMRTLRDIKEDPKYKNKLDLKATFQSKLGSSDESRPEGGGRILDEDWKNEWVELWEIHDQRTGRVFCISLDHNKFLREDFDYLQQEGLNARVLGFNEDPDYFWWAPDARMVEVQQTELNDIRTMAKAHRKVALLKVLYDKTLKPDELAKLLDSDPKAAVGIDVGPQGDIRKMVSLLQSHVPPDFQRSAAEVREDVREIIGFSRNQMGAYEAPGGRRTAHEAEIVRVASMIRVDERRDIMADMLSSIIRGMNQIIFENWTAERVVDIVGQDGARYWIRFTGKEIKGEFTYKINPEESQPTSTQTKRQEALEFMQVAMKTSGVDMKYLLETWASTFEWIDPKLLFPGEGAGRSPEKAMGFYDYMKMGPQGTKGSSYPGLEG